jgi:hypothetical protein
MGFLSLAIGVLCFPIGLLPAWSTSAKGSSVLAFLLGLLGGGGGGIALGGGHLTLAGRELPPDALATVLMAIGVGVSIGLIFGVTFKIVMAVKYPNAPKVIINMARPVIRPERIDTPPRPTPRK